MKKGIYFIVLMFVSLNIQADDYFNHGGIRYKIESFIDQELRVTNPNESDFSTTNLVIPATIKTKQGQVWTVTAIGDGAFTKYSGDFGYKNLRSITIPKTVKLIHKDAFKDGTIEEITADCSIEMPIEPLAKTLKKVYLGPSATISTAVGLTQIYYGDHPHWTNVSLSPANKTMIMENGVLYDKAKTKILWFDRNRAGAYIMPSTVKSMPKGTMKNAKNLTEFTFGKGYSGKIEEFEFDGCDQLKSVCILGPVKSIGSYAFGDCKLLKNVKLPETLEELSYGAFRRTGIEQITLPKSLKTVKDLVFDGCDNLRVIDIPEGIEIIPKSFCSSCKNLTKIILPRTVKEIKTWAFKQCNSLVSITIPKSVTYIGQGAFADCEKLSMVYCYASQATLFDYPFFRCPIKEFHCIKGTKEYYENSQKKESSIQSYIDDLTTE